MTGLLKYIIGILLFLVLVDCTEFICKRMRTPMGPGDFLKPIYVSKEVTVSNYHVCVIKGGPGDYAAQMCSKSPRPGPRSGSPVTCSLKGGSSTDGILTRIGGIQVVYVKKPWSENNEEVNLWYTTAGKVCNGFTLSLLLGSPTIHDIKTLNQQANNCQLSNIIKEKYSSSYKDLTDLLTSIIVPKQALDILNSLKSWIDAAGKLLKPFDIPNPVDSDLLAFYSMVNVILEKDLKGEFTQSSKAVTNNTSTVIKEVTKPKIKNEYKMRRIQFLSAKRAEPIPHDWILKVFSCNPEIELFAKDGVLKKAQDGSKPQIEFMSHDLKVWYGVWERQIGKDLKVGAGSGCVDLMGEQDVTIFSGTHHTKIRIRDN